MRVREWHADCSDRLVPMQIHDEKTRDLALKIMSYLDSNSHASDTFEGIFEWWLFKEEFNRSETEVRTALARLVGEGLVLEETRNLRLHYRVNPSMQREIKRLLKALRA